MRVEERAVLREGGRGGGGVRRAAVVHVGERRRLRGHGCVVEDVEVARRRGCGAPDRIRRGRGHCGGGGRWGERRAVGHGVHVREGVRILALERFGVEIDIHGHPERVLVRRERLRKVRCGRVELAVLLIRPRRRGRRAAFHHVVRGHPHEAAEVGEAEVAVLVARGGGEEQVLRIVVAFNAVEEGEEDRVGRVREDVAEVEIGELRGGERADGLVRRGAGLEDGKRVEEGAVVGETMLVPSGGVGRHRGGGHRERGVWWTVCTTSKWSSSSSSCAVVEGCVRGGCC